MRRILVVLALLAVLPAAGFAEKVNITAGAKGFTVASDSYRVEFSTAGALQSLAVGGVEFAAPYNETAGAFYPYSGGIVPVVSFKRSRSGFNADLRTAEVSYDFEPDRIIIELQNKSLPSANFFLLLPREVPVFSNGEEWVTSGVTATWKLISGFRAGQKLCVDGIDKLVPLANERRLSVLQKTLASGKKARLELSFTPPDAVESACVAALCPERTQASPQLVLNSPLPYQVFQRRDKASGPVLFYGTFRGKCNALTVEFEGRPNSGALPKAVSIPIGSDGVFELSIDLPSGGWYKAALSTPDAPPNSTPLAACTFGVGEVFVLAGQSNSTNCGETPINMESGMVASFSGTCWRLAHDPQPGPHDNSQGGSFAPAFGDELNRRLKVPIGIAMAGHSGTSVAAWQQGGELFSFFLARVNRLGRKGFRAVLWHQGESDVNMTTEQYEALLTSTIQASRAGAGWDIPWFVAQVSYHNPTKPSFDSVRNAQANIWKKGIAQESPDTDRLDGDNRDQNGKGIHFSEKGLKAHGRAWADKVVPWLVKSLGD